VSQKLLPGGKVARATVGQSHRSAESGSLPIGMDAIGHGNCSRALFAGLLGTVILQRGCNSMRKLVASATALTVLLIAGEAAGRPKSKSPETGMAEIHAWVKVGRKTCMLDHFHDGSGTGSTRAQAERAAVRSWAEFTAWEYGDPWGRYSIASSKKMTCSRESPTWRCAVEARPCRPY
jgi:hypothetical protein